MNTLKERILKVVREFTDNGQRGLRDTEPRRDITIVPADLTEAILGSISIKMPFRPLGNPEVITAYYRAACNFCGKTPKHGCLILSLDLWSYGVKDIDMKISGQFCVCMSCDSVLSSGEPLNLAIVLPLLSEATIK